MERHLRDAKPAYALVVWPDDIDQTQPSCINLLGLHDALAFGAVLIAREDAEFCKPRMRLLRLRYEMPADGMNHKDED